MSRDAANEQISRERRILRALCVADLSSNERAAACGSLGSYRFHDPHHQILFDVLREIPQATSAVLRERLPSLLTRRGFPDFDMEFFLSTKEIPGDLSLDELRKAIADLNRAPEKTLQDHVGHSGAAIWRLTLLIEVLAFSAFVGLFIWRLQFTVRLSWILFAIWLPVSFLLYRDTPKTLGWRADNLWPATRQAVIVFGTLSLAVLSIGFFLGSWKHWLPIISFHRWWNYFAFCLLQELALQSFVTNRLLMFFGEPAGRWKAALVAGAIFGALHWPNPVLVPVTFIGGFILAYLFSRTRNIIPLAIGQAVLGMLVWWAFPIAWHHGMRVGPGFYTFGH